MIKIIQVEVLPAHQLHLVFNDQHEGTYDLAGLIARDTVLTRPLLDADFFARVFLDLGALSWPNGLELSPAAIHHELKMTGALRPQPRVA